MALGREKMEMNKNEGEDQFWQPVTVVRLGIMMFLQFFIWGSWYVSAPKFLGQIGFTGTDFGWTYSVGPIAGMISPFFVGMIADRFFSTERVLAFLHILGGGTILAATTFMTSENSPVVINLMFFGHMLCYYSTLSLVNSISMHNLTNSEKQFPLVRVFGTIGWIVAGICVSFLKWDTNINMFYLGGGAAILLGIYCFTLPHTPPPARGKDVSFAEIAGLGAIKLLAKPSFLVFILCSFAICIPLAFYYQLAERAVTQAGIEEPTFKMTFGQMSEIVFMLVMPLFFIRLGVKWMLAVGMVAWVIRYLMFAFGSPIDDAGNGIAWMMLGGILLHGICYDFFFVTGQIYTDKIAPKEIRGQAQGLLVFFTIGLGMLIGAQVGGQIEKAYTPKESVAYSEEVQELNKKIEELKKVDEKDRKESVEELTKQKDEKQMLALQTMNWKSIWMIPAIASFAVLVIFILIFRDNSSDENENPDKKPS